MSILTRRCQWRAGHSCSSVFLDGHINVINSSEKHRRRAISCTPPPTHRRVPPSANHVPLVATAPPPQVDPPGRPTLAPAHQRQTPPRRTTLVRRSINLACPVDRMWPIGRRWSEENTDASGQKHTPDVPNVDVDSNLWNSRGRPGRPKGAAYLWKSTIIPSTVLRSMASSGCCSPPRVGVLEGVSCIRPQTGSAGEAGDEVGTEKRSIDVFMKFTYARPRRRIACGRRKL